MITIRKQIHNNTVALISLFIAVGSLAYNTWRNETTEEQRNVRHASFRVLENLGDLLMPSPAPAAGEALNIRSSCKRCTRPTYLNSKTLNGED